MYVTNIFAANTLKNIRNTFMLKRIYFQKSHIYTPWICYLCRRTLLQPVQRIFLKEHSLAFHLHSVASMHLHIILQDNVDITLESPMKETDRQTDRERESKSSRSFLNQPDTKYETSKAAEFVLTHNTPAEINADFCRGRYYRSARYHGWPSHHSDFCRGRYYRSARYHGWPSDHSDFQQSGTGHTFHNESSASSRLSQTLEILWNL